MIKRYSDDVLDTPMKPRIVGLLMTDEQVEAKCSEWAEEDMRNMLHLCEHYGIANSPSQFYELALHLAREHVPCFKVKPVEGRPKKWTDFLLGVLAVEIERLTATGATIQSAATTLAQRSPWCDLLEQWDEAAAHFGSDPAEALKTAYKNSKKSPFLNICRSAFAHDEREGNTHEWDKTMHEAAAEAMSAIPRGGGK